MNAFKRNHPRLNDSSLFDGRGADSRRPIRHLVGPIRHLVGPIRHLVGPIRHLVGRGLLTIGTVVVASATMAVAATTAGASPAPIDPSSTAPVVSYGGGFATTATNESGDVVLFTKAFTATSWTKKTIAKPARGDDYVTPEIASNGNSGLMIVARDSNDYLFSWSGSVGGTFQRETVSNTDSFGVPSIAYGPAGGNFAVADTDEAGNVDFWYQSGTAWNPELVESGQHVLFLSAAVTVTDTGIVVVASGNDQGLDVFYQPLFEAGWANTSIIPGEFTDISVAWTGTNVLVAENCEGVEPPDQTLQMVSYSDKGVHSSTTAVGESTTTGSLYGTAIAWSGVNATIVSRDGADLNFFYSHSSVFFEEPVAVDNPPGYLGYLYPGIAIADNTVEITDTEYPASLLGFSQATGGSGWPQKTIGT